MGKNKTTELLLNGNTGASSYVIKMVHIDLKVHKEGLVERSGLVSTKVIDDNGTGTYVEDMFRGLEGKRVRVIIEVISEE